LTPHLVLAEEVQSVTIPFQTFSPPEPQPTPSLTPEPSQAEPPQPEHPQEELAPSVTTPPPYIQKEKAGKSPEEVNVSGVDFSLRADATFPIWVGVGGEFTFKDRISIGGGYGYLPGVYTSLIGSILSNIGGSVAYGDLFQDIFISNGAPRVELEYHFSGEYGWFIGLGGYQLNANGQADFIDTLQEATGINLSTIKTLLIAENADISLKVKTSLTMLDFHAGYNWKLAHHIGLQFNLGLAKIVSSTFVFSSTSAVVDANSVVQQLYSGANSAVQSFVSSYGYIPFASLGLKFTF
jgi:hypothetical protein